MTQPTGEQLYLVLQHEPDDALEGERFERAIVFATSPEDAVERVCAYIELCNEAEEAGDEEDGDDLETGDSEDVASLVDEEMEEIQYDRDAFETILLAQQAVRPDTSYFDDLDSILVFQTSWNEPEDVTM